MTDDQAKQAPVEYNLEFFPVGDNPHGARLFLLLDGALGLDIGGSVVVKPIEEWHKIAWREVESGGSICNMEFVHPPRLTAVKSEAHYSPTDSDDTPQLGR